QDQRHQGFPRGGGQERRARGCGSRRLLTPVLRNQGNRAEERGGAPGAFLIRRRRPKPETSLALAGSVAVARSKLTSQIDEVGRLQVGLCIGQAICAA